MTNRMNEPHPTAGLFDISKKTAADVSGCAGDQHRCAHAVVD
jgi:hypothetical protein